MSGPRQPFGPAELPQAGAPDAGAALAIARELEVIAAGALAPGDDVFVDAVMAAIRQEPAPRPAVAAGRALRRGQPGRLVSAVLDAWLVALSGARPLRIRVEALALVLVAVVALGSVVSLGAMGVAGTLAILRQPSATVLPAPPATSGPTSLPSALPGRTPAPSAAPSEAAPSASPSPTLSPGESGEAAGTPRPRPSPTATEDDGPSGSAGETDDHHASTASPGASPSARPSSASPSPG